MTAELPSLPRSEIESAADRIRGLVHRTPLLHSHALDRRVGREVWLKAESFQRGGAFKARGAFNAALMGIEQGDRRGLIAMSSGNHGQAVALVAAELGLSATVVMAEGSSPVKVAAVAGYGAAVVTEGVTLANRERRAQELGERLELRLIHPHDGIGVVAGQATVGRELSEQLARRNLDPSGIVVPLGGGGLLAGVAAAAQYYLPGAAVYGAEPAAGDDGAQSLHSGQLVTLSEVPQTAADGARTLHLGQLPWSVIRTAVTEIATVSDEWLAEACWWLWTRMKLVVEPTGALALAALLAGDIPATEGKPVVCVLSGGNCEPAQMAELIRHRPAGAPA